MECNGTEAARSEASPVVRYGKKDLVYRFNASGGVVHRVRGAHVRKLRHGVEFLRRQGERGRIDN
ncbi:hypothetical protein SDC9_147417 [bioreactor metagenome]|uniref:Uncharacterized protein n=1 Tax=bioreactor metagenome TaxID=1076179 RepID=A0A645EHZ8_9ZZZZ